MIAPDVNVLVCALREDLDGHAGCYAWLDRARRGPRTLVLFEPVLAGMLRLVTNRRVFPVPTARVTAEAFIDALLASPSVVPLRAGERHWPIFLALCRQADCRGNLLQDAYFAALALEHNCDWVTTDRDFARFPGLRWWHPLQP